MIMTIVCIKIASEADLNIKKNMEQDERYKYIDVDTLETMSVMLDLPSI